jgi:hypothetical protein
MVTVSPGNISLGLTTGRTSTSGGVRSNTSVSHRSWTPGPGGSAPCVRVEWYATRLRVSMAAVGYFAPAAGTKNATPGTPGTSGRANAAVLGSVVNESVFAADGGSGNSAGR